MMSSLFTHKKTSSHSNTKKNAKKKSQIDDKIFDIYGVNKKYQKKKTTRKIFVQEDSQNNKNQTYQFPQFKIYRQKKSESKVEKPKQKNNKNVIQHKNKSGRQIQGIAYRKKEQKSKGDPIHIIDNNLNNNNRVRESQKINKENIKNELEQEFNKLKIGKSVKQTIVNQQDKILRQTLTVGGNERPKQSIYDKNRQIVQQQNKENNEKKQLYELYIESVKKIFKILDIFNRGKIAQINMNKCVPEYALYFLGSIFQKIKQYRLILIETQFIDYCLPLFTTSKSQDIKQFIIEVDKSQVPLKTSINIPNPIPIPIPNPNHNYNHNPKPNDNNTFEHKTPLRDKYVNEEHHSSSYNKQQRKNSGMVISQQKSLNNYNNNNLDELLKIIHVKQMQLNCKIKQIKNKKENLIQEKSLGQSFNKIKNELIKIKLAQSQIKKSICSQSQPNNMRNSIQEFSSKLYENLSRQKEEMRSSQKLSAQYSNMGHNNNYNYQKQIDKIYTKQNELVPNFTFQLPKDKPYHFNPMQQKRSQHIYNNKHQKQKDLNNTSDLLKKRSKGQVNNNLTDRLVQKYNRQRINSQNHYFNKTAVKNDRSTSGRPYDQQDKIEKLNNKLQQYLRLNQKKIKNSQIFLMENSYSNK